MRNGILLCALAVTLGAAAAPRAQQARAAADWPQWGGPHRNFMTDSTGLACAWPAGGPKKLWSRALGEGHCAIAAQGNRLYTMSLNSEIPLIIESKDHRIARIPSSLPPVGSES